MSAAPARAVDRNTVGILDVVHWAVPRTTDQDAA
jgi:hypothetical protein